MNSQRRAAALHQKAAAEAAAADRIARLEKLVKEQGHKIMDLRIELTKLKFKEKK